MKVKYAYFLLVMFYFCDTLALERINNFRQSLVDRLKISDKSNLKKPFPELFKKPILREPSQEVFDKPIIKKPTTLFDKPILRKPSFELFKKPRPSLLKSSSESSTRTKRQTFFPASNVPLEDVAKTLKAKLVHGVKQGSQDFPGKARIVVDFKPKDTTLIPRSTIVSLDESRPFSSESSNFFSGQHNSDSLQSVSSFDTSSSKENFQDTVSSTSQDFIHGNDFRPINSDADSNLGAGISATQEFSSPTSSESHMIRGFKGDDDTIFFIDLADLRASGLEFDDVSDLSITGVSVSEVTNFDDIQVHSLSNVEDALNDFSDDLFDVKPPAFEKSKVNRKNLNDQRVFNNPIHTHDATKISNHFSSTPPPVITFRPSSLISESENLRNSEEPPAPKLNPLRHLNPKFQLGAPISGNDNSLETLDEIKSIRRRVVLI